MVKGILGKVHGLWVVLLISFLVIFLYFFYNFYFYCTHIVFIEKKILLNLFTQEIYFCIANTLNKKRQNSILEFIQTEKVYVDDMAVVHEIFEVPLKKSGIIGREEAEQIFANWQDILQCNRSFLKDLNFWAESGSDVLGPIVCKHVRF